MTAGAKYSIILTSFFLAIFATISAQTGTSVKDSFEPEFRRLINHEAITREQKGLLASDGKVDNEFVVSNNEEINFLLTRLLMKGGAIDEMRYKIEKDTIFDHRLKVNYLSGLANVLKYVKQNWRSRKVNILHLPEIITAYDECMQKDRNGQSISPVISPLS
jgi:hypothetical protein